jgi:hypothetical protein
MLKYPLLYPKMALVAAIALLYLDVQNTDAVVWC